jgi:SAM-dependent methyltransferase
VRTPESGSEIKVHEEDVNQDVSPNDVMYRSDPDHYFLTGRQAFEAIQRFVRFLALSPVNTILDLPSGHGRVLRFLRVAYPNALIDACDLDRDGVDFCTRSLGARPVYSTKGMAEVPLSATYDLIWCGSLFTHVHSNDWRDALQLFADHLRNDGLVVFTTHGRYHANRLRAKQTKLGLSDWAVSAVLSDYDRLGFGFQNYAGSEGYGISLSAAPWVCFQVLSTQGLRLVGYQERGWADHQDVVACVKDRR